MKSFVEAIPISRISAIIFLALFLWYPGFHDLRAESPEEVFAKRIVPIFKSPNPSSCVQCHLASVDLKNYILPSAQDTFLSLRDQGLIDLDNIDKSKILGLIQRGGDDKSRKAEVHQANRKSEYEAFLNWLKTSAADPKLRNAPKLDTVAKPAKPVEVIRHNRKDSIVESFTSNVWSMRFRCMNCHSEGNPQSDKLVRENGPQVAWFKKAGPEATLDYLITTKLIDLDKPEKSLLLTKPLNEVKHGGGVKFTVGDQGYKAMRSFLEDYAKIVKDGYKTADQLPKRPTVESFGSERWLKISDTPAEWADKLAQVFVYAWDAKANVWEKNPIATTDRVVWGKGKTFQHTLTLLADKGSDRAKAFAASAKLDRGKYLVKVFVDRDGKLAKDWTGVLGDNDYAGQAEVMSDWKDGYGAMTVVPYKNFRK